MRNTLICYILGTGVDGDTVMVERRSMLAVIEDVLALFRAVSAAIYRYVYVYV